MFAFFKKKEKNTTETPEEKIKKTVEDFYGLKNEGVIINSGNTDIKELNSDETIDVLLKKLENKLKEIILQNSNLEDLVEFLEFKKEKDKRNKEIKKQNGKTLNIDVTKLYDIFERLEKILEEKSNQGYNKEKVSNKKS
ncbi:MAG TPA: hypothetical protein EYH54_00005 [Nautiliaceae bacterium]|nr:hypothetical protein [Nautiliaceae bacterium]